MAKLSEAAERVLASIIRLSEGAHGRSPTFPEISEDIQRSVSSVQLQVRNLAAWGYLHQSPGMRGFHVLKNPDGSLRQQRQGDLFPDTESGPTTTTLHLPILGTASAGQPIEAVDSDPETFPVPPEWCHGTCYLLRIRGESMSGDGIQDGDLVLVEATDQVQTGAIHVCWLPGEGATIKRVTTKADVAELVASNADFVPVSAPRGTIVQGRVIWVFRQLTAGKRRSVVGVKKRKSAEPAPLESNVIPFPSDD